MLRKEFSLDAGHGDVVAATLHVTAHGIVEPTLNGVAVSDDVLTPGLEQLRVAAALRARYDVTALVAETSVLGLALGNGWFRGRLGWSGKGAFYGSELAGLAELHVEFADGHRQVVGTDATWQAGPSATTANDLYDGQTIDARLASSAWTRPGGGPDRVGRGPRRWTTTPARLQPYVGPPVRRQEVLRPVKVWTSPAGATLVDFGQNLVGWLRFTVQGPAGSEITVRHAEVLEHDELGTRPLRSARATDRFILSGGVDAFEPTKTFHGFRYAEVTGWPGELTADALEAVVVHSELRRTGTFECSDELLNQLHRNVVWGLKGNFLDVPTDCPQRDERLGWTGDIAAFAPTRRLPLRRLGLPRQLAGRPRPRAAPRRRAGAVRRPRRPQVRRAPVAVPGAREHGDLERRRSVGAVGAVGGVRRPRGARSALSRHDGPHPPRRGAALRHRPVGHRLPVR